MDALINGYPVSTKAEGLTWKFHSWRRQQVNLLPSSPRIPIISTSLPPSLSFCSENIQRSQVETLKLIKRAQHQLLISSASVIAAGLARNPSTSSSTLKEPTSEGSLESCLFNLQLSHAN